MWRSRNLAQWNKTHAQLWPGAAPPELLVPIASNTGAAQDDQDDQGDQVAQGKGRRLFVEGTLPSSLVFASLFSQCSVKRLSAAQRCKYMSVFYEVLMAVCRGGKLQLSLDTSQGRQTVCVSASGNVATQFLFGSLAPEQLEELKETWLMDAQDGFFSEFGHICLA